MSWIRGLVLVGALLGLAPSATLAGPKKPRHVFSLLVECRKHFAKVAQAGNISLAGGRDTKTGLNIAQRNPRSFEGRAYWLFAKLAKADKDAFSALISFGVTKTNFIELGRFLRGESIDDHSRLYWKQFAEKLDRLFEKAPKFNGVVFRGEVRPEGSRVSKADGVEKAFLSTSLAPEIALGHADPKSQTNVLTEQRNFEDFHYELDSPYFDEAMSDIQRDIIYEKYGERPLRIFTVFDFRKNPVPALWMPAAYKVLNPERLDNMFTATGQVWREDEVLFPRKLKFRTTQYTSVVGEDGLRYVFRIREPMP